MQYKTNEWTEHITKIFSISNLQYPRGGSQGIYIDKLFETMIQLNGKEKDLFLVMCLAMNEYNQVLRTRKELSKAIGITRFDSGNMSKMLKKLVDLEMIAVFGRRTTINPFIILPKGKTNAKLKDALQLAWEELIMYSSVTY